MSFVTTLAEAEPLKKDGDVWYFAYGSNLDVGRKESRTGAIRAAVPARLNGFRFAFGKCDGIGGAYADIIDDPSESVFGVIYLCDRPAMHAFNIREGVADRHYRRQIVSVLAEEHTPVDAVTYVACDERRVQDRRPEDWYLDLVLSGGRHHGLPGDYLAMIERLAIG